MSSTRHRRKVKARKQAQLDAVRRAEAWSKLSSHERYQLARSQEWENTPSLPLAAVFRDTETIKAMIAEGENPESSAADGVTALMYSARFGELDVVHLLFNAGANVNQRDNERGATALICAAENAHVTLLLSRGADPQVKRTSGHTFLHGAVGGHASEIIEIALAAGLDVNARTEDGLTLLRIAAWSRSPRILKTLIEHGADINAQTNWGSTALIAVTADDQSFRPAHAECTALLVERGADVNAQDAEGNTPLMGEAWYGDLQVVKYLKEHEAKLDITNARGHTAASKALTAGNMDIAEFLGVTT